MNKELQYKEYAKGYNKYIYKVVPSCKKILDVGCNTGLLGEKLINEKKCIVYGVDYSHNAIALAKKKLTNALVFDLEKEGVPYSNERFDIIIFGDVLEHLHNPGGALKKFKKLLSKDGIIIVSLPNVANINIRLDLLLGRWNYKPWGILDRTHLKFFTLNTAKELVISNNYSILKIYSTPGFHFIILRGNGFLRKIAEIICKIYPKLFALQFIIVENQNDVKT